MSLHSTAWDDEIERRIRIYDELDANGKAEGRLGRVDYTVMAALAVVLVAGFWAWGGV